MIYKINRPVPAETVEGVEDKQKLEVSKGTLIQWGITMPPQCADLCKFKVFYHNIQLLPFTRGTWAYGFFEPTIFYDSIKIDTPPYVLDIHAVNTDDTFTHEYNLYVNIEPKQPIKPDGSTGGFYDRWKNLFKGGG